MPDLVEAFDRVNAIKGDDHWRPDADSLRQITEKLRAELGEGFNAKGVEDTIMGLGWVGRMLVEYGLDFEQLMVTAERLTDATLAGVDRSKLGLTPEQGLQAGIGAGYFTGLYMGLMIGRASDGTA